MRKGQDEMGETELHINKMEETIGRQSQDGGVERRGVHVSPQLGYLLDSGGGPRLPRRQEEPLSNRVGCGGERGGRRSGGWTGLAPLRGGWERGGVPMPGGPSGAWRSRRQHA